MAKVKIKNTCKDQCIGFSFKPLLKPNQTTVVEEERITDADKRLIDKGLATLDKWDGVIDKAPIQRVPESPKEEKEKKPPQEIITSKTVDPEAEKEEADQIVTPSDVAEQKAEDEVSIETSTEEEAAPNEHTRKELEKLGLGELRAIGKPMGIRGRAIEKLVDDILAAQSNAE